MFSEILDDIFSVSTVSHFLLGAVLWHVAFRSGQRYGRQEAAAGQQGAHSSDQPMDDAAR
ncbi:hypothetical protein BOQ63_000465 (plasmid) [Streptomyces viridifaciens]|nr:hypothetical protein BOQ63_000465 [Streptomyces viridifaciens]